MRLAALVLLLFSMVLLAGCLHRLSYGSTGFQDYYRDNLQRLAVSSPEDLEACQEGKCWCMVCKNNTEIFKGKRNLIGGSCYIDKECNADRMRQLNDPTQTPDTYPLQFMIGIGPTFGDFGEANTYCANRLTMAVQWLVGTKDSPYLLPDAERSMCFLSKTVMPVFVLYSNGTNINASRAEDIARTLGTRGSNYYEGLLSKGPVGPVVVVTEMNFDKSQAALVAEQVRRINRACGNDRAGNKINCFVAVAPKMNDFEALDAVVDELGGRDGDWDMVDLVAYGIDGRYTSTCDGKKAIHEALNFSGYALYNYTKPTIIPYIMFDNASTNRDGTCTWTENQVVEAYKAFFPFNIQSLQKRGVIGIAPYSYNSTGSNYLTNPLNCTSCSVASTQARLQAWFGGCQSYAKYNRLGSSEPSDTTQILFGNTSGTSCNSNFQMSYIGGFNFAGRDLLQSPTTSAVVKENRSFACDKCLTDNIKKNLTDYFTEGLQIARGAAFYNQEFCTKYPEVEQWASARNLDPMYVRAIIATESGFNPCDAAKVCGPTYNEPGCFDNKPGADECYYDAFDEMYIPDGTPDCVQLQNDIVGPGQTPRWRWCAFGLMQSLEPPISFWPAQYRQDGQDGQYYEDVFKRAGLVQRDQLDMDNAKACDPVDFNPFTVSDSLCIGTAKMESRMRYAESWIEGNKDKLNWDTKKDEDKTNLFAAYIAANDYSGIWQMKTESLKLPAAGWSFHPRCPQTKTMNVGDCWAIGFKNSWQASPGVLLDNTYCSSSEGENDNRCVDGKPRNEPPGYCYGYTDFIYFVEQCEVPFLPVESDRGRVKMEAYIKLGTDCNSTCPDGKKYFALGNLPVPESGIPYMPDSLTQTQTP